MVKIGDTGGSSSKDSGRDAGDAGDRGWDAGHDAGSHKVADQTDDRGERSIVVSDHKGRPLATTRGQMDGSTYHLTKADAKVGRAGDAGAAKLGADLHRKGITVDASKVKPIEGESTRRSIGADLEIATTPTDRPRDRPDIAAMHPTDYVPATSADHAMVRDLRSRSADPHRWVESINPGHDAQVAALQRGEAIPHLNRVTNCTEASRAVQDTLEGRPRAAAAGTYEGYDRIDTWAGKPNEAATFDGVEARLSEPGDSAVLVATFNSVRGHAFNAVNIDGKVWYVDGQTGEVSDWPPRLAEETRSLRAWYFEK